MFWLLITAVSAWGYSSGYGINSISSDYLGGKTPYFGSSSVYNPLDIDSSVRSRSSYDLIGNMGLSAFGNPLDSSLKAASSYAGAYGNSYGTARSLDASSIFNRSTLGYNNPLLY